MIAYLVNSASCALDMTATLGSDVNNEIFTLPMGGDDDCDYHYINGFDTNADDIIVVSGETNSRKFVAPNSVMDHHLSAVAHDSATCFAHNRKFSFIHASRANGEFMWIKFFPFDYSSNQAYYDYGYRKFISPTVRFPKPSSMDSTATTDPPIPSGYLMVTFATNRRTVVLMNVADGSIVSTHTTYLENVILF